MITVGGVGQDTLSTMTERSEGARKGSERMTNRAIMPKNQVSSGELSEIS